MDAQEPHTPSSILLTGATGYIGGRLLQRLEAEGHRIRCLSRHPESLRDRVASTTEVVYADMLKLDSLRKAMQGNSMAYYLVHSMGSTGSFEVEDRQAAQNFGQAAHDCGVRRIIFLGGGWVIQGRSFHPTFEVVRKLVTSCVNQVLAFK